MKPKTSEILDRIVAQTKDHSLRLSVQGLLSGASDTGDFYHIKTNEFISNGGTEIRVALRAAARVIDPICYLEVGVRYGWSAAQAIAEMGDCSLAAPVGIAVRVK